MTPKKDLQYQNFEIIGSEMLSSDTVLLRIKGRLIFEPGQFIQVSLPNYGEGSFAPCNDPRIKNYFEICVRSCGNLTRQLIKMVPGDHLDIRGPYGNSWPIGKLLENNILMITGGMGTIPLKPLIAEILRNRGDFKKVSLIAGFKTGDHIIFKEDFKIWQKKLDNAEICLEYGNSELETSNGLITSALNKFKIDKNTIVLMCGPEIMRAHCQEVLSKKNVPEKNIYISFERRVECGIGVCQHCNIGKYLICRDGPIFRLDIIKDEIGK